MPTILLLTALLAAGHIGTSEACKTKMDLCFCFDASSTVCGGNEPCDNWRSALDFSKAVTATLDIGQPLVRGKILDRVAFVTFTNKSEVLWNLKGYPDKNSVLSAIDGVEFKGGEFYDIPSVNVILTKVFSPVGGDNPFVKNILFVISDGIPNLATSVSEAASAGLQEGGLTIFLICVAPLCTEEWAKAIASKPEKADLKTYFMVDSYSALESVRETVLENICYFLEPTKSKPIININITLTVG